MISGHPFQKSTFVLFRLLPAKFPSNADRMFGWWGSEQTHGGFCPRLLALRNFRFGMEPARRFAPRTWVPQLPAASGRSRARMSITRCLPAAGVPCFCVSADIRTWLDSLTDRVEVHARSFTSPSDLDCCTGRWLDHLRDKTSRVGVEM